MAAALAPAGSDADNGQLETLVSDADDGPPSEPVESLKLELSPVPEDGAAFSADHLSPRSIQTTSLMGALLFQQHQQREAQKDAAENTTPPGNKGVKRRRVVKRDPNKPSPKAWSAEEVQRFKDLIEKEGPGGWEKKSVKLGSGRSAKALHTRWLREQGRIVDRPRGLTTSTSAESSPGHDASSTKSKSAGSRPRPAKAGSAKASSAKGAQKKAASSSSDSDDGSAPKRRRRIGTRDPNKPSPKAWSEEEVERFKQLIDADGPGSWENKAVQLGSGRSAKALHTRWLRDQGRIVDRPRVALTTSNANVGEVAAMETLMLLAKLGR